jgi:hypothetical protein
MVEEGMAEKVAHLGAARKQRKRKEQGTGYILQSYTSGDLLSPTRATSK